MSHGWTGGQYSAYRVVLGVWLAAVFAASALGPGGTASRAASGAAALAALVVAVGRFDRAAALLALALGVGLPLLAPLVAPRGWPVYAWLLAAHALAPAAPYGSLAAAGRADPGGGWRLPRWLYAAHWPALALVAGGVVLATGREAAPGWVLASGAAIAVLGLALSRRARPWLWALLAAGWVAQGAAGAGVPGALLLLLAASDPGWVRRVRPDLTEVLFYDGTCGLCHRAVRFVLAEDRMGTAYRFAPLGGETFAARVDEERRRALPDSLVVLSAEGDLLTRTAGVRRLALRLGGLWRAIAELSRVVPAPIWDRVYDAIASVRHRWFARPAESCPVTPETLRRRFDP